MSNPFPKTDPENNMTNPSPVTNTGPFITTNNIHNPHGAKTNQNEDSPTSSFFYSLLFDMAYKDQKTSIRDDEFASQVEKDLFLKYNNPIPNKEQSEWRPKHVRYIPHGTVQLTDSDRTVYPIFRPNLGFKPSLNYFQSFSQNIYSDDMRILEEKDIRLQSIKPINFKQMLGEDYRKKHEITIFKIMMEHEAFRT